MTNQTVTVINNTGIHARPAALLVKEASKYQSKIQLKTAAKTADAKSILMLMGLGANKGTEVTICADGPDETEAVAALVNLFQSKFGEQN